MQRKERKDSDISFKFGSGYSSRYKCTYLRYNQYAICRFWLRWKKSSTQQCMYLPYLYVSNSFQGSIEPTDLSLTGGSNTKTLGKLYKILLYIWIKFSICFNTDPKPGVLHMPWDWPRKHFTYVIHTKSLYFIAWRRQRTGWDIWGIL